MSVARIAETLQRDFRSAASQLRQTGRRLRTTSRSRGVGSVGGGEASSKTLLPAGPRPTGRRRENFERVCRSAWRWPVVFDFVEEALDEIALAIEHEITIALRLAVGFWWDHRSDGSLIECVDQRIGVVS